MLYSSVSVDVVEEGVVVTVVEGLIKPSKLGSQSG